MSAFVVIWLTDIGVDQGETPILAVDGPFESQQAALGYAQGFPDRQALVRGWHIKEMQTPLTGFLRTETQMRCRVVRERRTSRGLEIGTM